MSTVERETSSDRRAIASTVYDTAWVAAVPEGDERRNPRFPTALNWVAANQLADGSWGSPVHYVPDRIICTLAALIPLARFGRRESDLLQVRRGERYLWQQAHLLQREPCVLVGFELLLPTLLQLATEAGVVIPLQLDAFAGERARKMALLPPDVLYSPRVTLAHSLEFLGSEVNPLQLLEVRGANGSIGNSPAATAFLLHYIDDPAAVTYVESCLASDGGSAVSVLDPCETYEALWEAYHRFLGGVPAGDLLLSAFRTQLVAALAAHGVSLSPSFPVPDADDTAVALLLLAEAGIAVDPTVLEQFEREEYFVSFPYERHASTGVNVHVLHALLRYPTYRHRDAALRKILQFLTVARQHGSYWRDKWHISPYYATGHAIIALAELPPDYHEEQALLMPPAVQWLLHTQNEDGSWGFYGTPTVEETAYAVLALRAAHMGHAGGAAALAAGEAYVAQHAATGRPALWIDKCLYHPTHIVEAVVQAALPQTGLQPAVA